MEEISSVQGKVHQESFINFKNPILLSYLFYPIRAGLFGFALFFTTIFISKYIGYVVKSANEFYIDMNDVILSLLGFVLLWLLKFLENFNQRAQKNKMQ